MTSVPAFAAEANPNPTIPMIITAAIFLGIPISSVPFNPGIVRKLRDELRDGRWEMGDGRWEMGSAKREMRNAECGMGNAECRRNAKRAMRVCNDVYI